MRLFGRTRLSRAEARVLTVEHLEGDAVCRIEVRPPTAASFESELRTRWAIYPGTLTYVKYDPDAPGHCELDVKRLRAMGVRDEGRAYAGRDWKPKRPERVSRQDAKRLLEELDALKARAAAGELSDQELEAERARLLHL